MINGGIQTGHAGALHTAAVIQMLQMTVQVNPHLIGCMDGMQRQGFRGLVKDDAHDVFLPG